jgi:competence protein ComEA
LPVGAILQDAVRAAGGFTEAADDERLNLALPLSDGMHVHVPNLIEEVVVEPAGNSSNPSPSATGAIININTAGLAELELLPGIGPATAQKIIDYRQENGPFSTIEEVQNVSGIGPVKYELIFELITVQ